MFVFSWSGKSNYKLAKNLKINSIKKKVPSRSLVAIFVFTGQINKIRSRSNDSENNY